MVATACCDNDDGGDKKTLLLADKIIFCCLFCWCFNLEWTAIVEAVAIFEGINVIIITFRVTLMLQILQWDILWGMKIAKWKKMFFFRFLWQKSLENESFKTILLKSSKFLSKNDRQENSQLLENPQHSKFNVIRLQILELPEPFRKSRWKSRSI